MQSESPAIVSTQRDITRAIAWKFALASCSGWLFAWGTAVIVARVALGIDSAWLAWGAAALLPLVAGAVVAAKRRTPGAAVVRAFLDGENRGGGLVMAEHEVELGAWRERVPQMRAARVRLNARRQWVLPLLAGVFVASGFLLPSRLVDTLRGSKLDTSLQAGTIEKQIQVLEKENLIESREAQEWREKLEQITGDTSGNDPSKTWEALDHLEKGLSRKAEAAAAKDLQNLEKLATLEEAADGLTNDDLALSKEELTEAMAEVGKRVGKMVAERNMLESLPPELTAAASKGNLSKEQMQQLAKLLKGNQVAVMEQLRAMTKAGLIDPEALKRAVEAGQGTGEPGGPGGEGSEAALQELALFLKDQGDGQSMEQRLDLFMQAGGAPGRGGITRGGGRAPLAMNNNATDDGTKFKPQTLPPSKIDSLKDSKLIGTSAAAPTVNENGASSGGALDHAAAGGGSAATHALLPRHQAVVKRYFDHQRKPN